MNFRNKASTILNILGMTAAFAAFYIILVQVNHDLSYNRRVKDADRVYIVSLPDWYEEGKYMTWVNRPPFEQLISSCSYIEAGGTGYISGQQYKIIVGKGDSAPEGDEPALSTTVSSLNPGAAKALGVEFVSGSADDLISSATLAVAESEAARLGLHPGSEVILKQGSNINFRSTVKAIYRDSPHNSDLDSFKMFVAVGEENINDWSEWSYNYFLKAREGVSKDELEQAGGKLLLDVLGQDADMSEEDKAEQAKRFRLHLIPLTDSYFDQTVSNAPGATGNKTTTMTLLAVAILVIVIAFINFINFFFALVPLRVHSVNTRKVLGASRGRLVVGYVLEAVVMVAVSLVLAAGVTVLFQRSSFASLISCSTAFADNVGVALSAVALGLLVAVASSLYPAFYITSFSPALALKGNFGASRSGRGFRYALVGVQFFISMSLIICATFITLQRAYMVKHDMGFDREELLVANVSNAAASSAAAVEAQLMENPQIRAVSWADGDIVRSSRMGWGRSFKGQQISFQCYPVSWDFLRFMGIPIVEGRDFTEADEQSEDGVFIFNEAAKKEFGLTLDDKLEGHRGEAEIAGFCHDFNFRSLRDGVSPLCLYVFGKHPWRRLKTLLVRTDKNADIPAIKEYVMSVVEKTDPSMSPEDIDVQMLDQQIQNQYRQESMLSTQIGLFSLLAVIISLMGVFGLVMFETEHRRKEIAVRRVNGATVGSILRMFNMEFLRIVLVCFVLAVPVCCLVIGRYLQGFAFKVPMYPWVFVMALAATLLVTVAVVTLRSYKAATDNPSLTLRKE